MPFGLEAMSFLVGVAFAYFLLPTLIAFVMGLISPKQAAA